MKVDHWLQCSDVKADLLSSTDVDGDAANGWVQIVAVAQAEASDVYAALSGPPWGEVGGLMFPLCLVVRGCTLKQAHFVLLLGISTVFDRHQCY